MEPYQVLVAILGSGGIGAAIVALVNGMIKWLSGAAAREKAQNTDLISQRRHAVEERNAAFEERDREAARRRKAEEYASSLRRQLIENDITPAKWYNAHETDDTLDAEEIKRIQQVRKKKKETKNEPYR